MIYPFVASKKHTLTARYHLRVKRWKKIFQADGPHKQAWVAILISDKIDFKPKLIRRDGEGQYILSKEKIHQEDIAILNIYEQNTRLGHTTS